MTGLFSHMRSPCPTGREEWDRVQPSCCRKRELELGTSVRMVRNGNAAAVAGNDRLAYGKANAHAGILGGEEALEDPVEVSFGNSGAGVANGKGDGAVGIDVGAELYPP